jgi:uncharacterized phiE125 gp8 family phage protein
MALTLITAPTVEPVSLVEARAHLRIDASGSPPSHADDSYVSTLLLAARKALDGKDGWLNRALLPQTWDLSLDTFPINEIRIPLPPLIEIVSIKYDDEDGIEQTVASTDYVVDDRAEPGWVVPALNVAWPATLETLNAVRIRFRCGYTSGKSPEDATGVPETIKLGLLLMVGTWYQNRESVVIGTTVAELPLAVDSLLLPYKVMWFG